MIIDSHRHVWDTTETPISWIQESDLPPHESLPSREAAGYDGARRYVLIEADADDPFAEAEYLLALARQDRRIHGVVPSLALEERTHREVLEHWAETPEVVGVRRLLQDRDLFTSEHLHANLRIMAEHGVPFDACVRAHQLPQLAEFVQRHPRLTVVLDHMGKPPLEDSSLMSTWRRDLERLAQVPQVVCKLSGLPAEARDLDQLESRTAEVIGGALETFGAERCLVGSDEPVSRDPRDWCRRVLQMTPSPEREQVARLTAETVYSRRG